MRDLIKRNANKQGYTALSYIRSEGCNKVKRVAAGTNSSFNGRTTCERSKGWKAEKPAMKRSGMRALPTYVGTTQGLARVDAFENVNFCKSNFAATLDSPQPACDRR